MSHLRFVISGLPACGKTTYGDWLRDNRGFTHVDIETLPNRRKMFNHFRNGQILLGVAMLPVDIPSHDRIVFTWGYPPGPKWRNVIAFLRDTHGFRPWWFTGPRHIAGEAWIARERRVHQLSDIAADDHFKAFTAQADLIQLQQVATAKFYGGSILQTLNTDRSRLSPEAISTHIGIPSL